MLEEFKFAMCHHKTKKRIAIVQNFDLNNDLKLIEPKRYVNYFEDNSDYSYLTPIDQYKQHLIKVQQMRSANLNENQSCSCLLKE